MKENMVGNQIHHLRKVHKVTQEELAKVLGVTTQAVSKWENGGMPDAMLLPAIAEFFNVTIDTLYGKQEESKQTISETIVKGLRNLPKEERIKKAYEYCWSIQVGICGEIVDQMVGEKLPSIPMEKEYYSRILTDEGMVAMKLGEEQYFFLLPETEQRKESLLADVDQYCNLFRMLSNPDCMKAILFLYGRNKSGFTNQVLEHKLHFGKEKAQKIIDMLLEQELLQCIEVETQTGMLKTYQLKENSAILPFLLFAKELIKEPEYMYLQLEERNKPFI